MMVLRLFCSLARHRKLTTVMVIEGSLNSSWWTVNIDIAFLIVWNRTTKTITAFWDHCFFNLESNRTESLKEKIKIIGWFIAGEFQLYGLSSIDCSDWSGPVTIQDSNISYRTGFKSVQNWSLTRTVIVFDVCVIAELFFGVHWTSYFFVHSWGHYLAFSIKKHAGDSPSNKHGIFEPRKSHLFWSWYSKVIPS